MMRKKNIRAQGKGFSYRNSTMLFRFVFFIFSVNLHCQIYLGENTRISVIGETAIYTKDTVSPSESIQKESSTVYVHQGTIISGSLSNDIAYIGKPETKKKIRQKQFAATWKEKAEKSVEASSRAEQKASTVFYGTANRRALGVCASTSDSVIIPASNSYKSAAVALEEPKRNNTIPHSKDRITYTSFIRIAAACYTFYALRGPPLPYLKS